MKVLSLPSRFKFENIFTPEQLLSMRLMGLDEAAVWSRVQHLLWVAENTVLQGLRGMDMGVFLATVGGQPTSELLAEQQLSRWREIWKNSGYPAATVAEVFPLFHDAGLPRSEWVRAMQQIRLWNEEKLEQERRDFILRLYRAGARQSQILAWVSPKPTLDELSEVLDNEAAPSFGRRLTETADAQLYRAWQQVQCETNLETLLFLAETNDVSLVVVSERVDEWTKVQVLMAQAKSIAYRKR